MPRNNSGNYTLPTGNPVKGDTLITADWANLTLSDIAGVLTNSLDRYGYGGMLGEFKVIDGTVSAPGLAFISQSNLGLFRDGSGVLAISAGGVAVARFSASAVELLKPLSGNLTLAGNLAMTGDLSLTGNLIIAGGIGTSGPVALPLGTAAAPALTFLNDLNTGLFSPVPDSIGVAIGGVETVRFSDDAIELAGPGAFVTVTHTGGAAVTGGFLAKSPPGKAAGISLAGNGYTPEVTSFDLIQDAAGEAIIRQRANKALRIFQNGLQRFALDSSAYFFTDVVVQKASPTLNLSKAASGENAYITGTLNGQPRWGLFLGDSQVESGGNAGSDFVLGRYADNGTYLGYAIFAKRSDGGVIIPKLTVSQIFGATAEMVGLANVTNNKQIMLNMVQSPSTAISIGWNGALTLQIDATYFGAVWPIGISGSAGSLGGYAASSYVRGSGIALVGLAIANNPWVPFLQDPAGTMNVFLCRNAGEIGGFSTTGTPLYLYVYKQDIGGVQWGACGMAPPSDLRLKKDVSPSTHNVLDDIREMDFIQFRFNKKSNWNDQDTLFPVGFSGQNLQSIAPHYVDEVGTDEDDLRLTPAIYMLLPVVFKAVQELDAVLQDLAVRIANLEGAI